MKIYSYELNVIFNYPFHWINIFFFFLLNRKWNKNLKTQFSSLVDDNLAHVTRCRRNSVLNLSGYGAIEWRHTLHDSGRISVNLHNKIVRRPVRSVYSVAILYYIFIEETTTCDESRIVAGYIIFRERVRHSDGTTRRRITRAKFYFRTKLETIYTL